MFLERLKGLDGAHGSPLLAIVLVDYQQLLGVGGWWLHDAHAHTHTPTSSLSVMCLLWFTQVCMVAEDVSQIHPFLCKKY